MIENHIHHARICLGIVSVIAALSTGCASSSPDLAKAKQQTVSVGDASRQWKQGNDLVASGEKVKAKGSVLVADGQKQMAEGDSLILRGKTLMAESENAFRDASKGVGGPVSQAK